MHQNTLFPNEMGHSPSPDSTPSGKGTPLCPRCPSTTRLYILPIPLFTLAASSGKRNVTVWRRSVRPSVCSIGILTVTHQVAVSDAANVHFGPTVSRTDILVTHIDAADTAQCKNNLLSLTSIYRPQCVYCT